MITLNGKQYKLAQLDTNMISEMVKNQSVELRNFMTRYMLNQDIEYQYLPCISAFTVLELMDKSTVYEKFLDIFSNVPFSVLKSYEQLFLEELAHYPDRTGIEVVMLTPVNINDMVRGVARETLKNIFEDDVIQNLRKSWNKDKNQILNGILGLVSNYPREDGYSKKRVRNFVSTVCIQQIVDADHEFIQRVVESGNVLEEGAFRSLKAQLFMVFYKFYVDKTRKPTISDVFDIIMAASYPYVDAVFTERHQAESIMKTKRVDPFLDHLEVHNISSLR